MLDILEQYTLGLQLLDDDNHQRLKKPIGSESTYTLKYHECIKLIDEMRNNNESDIFGIERGGAFKLSIGAIYQTFDGKESIRL